ncbi:MAG TPA: hypothetical protein PKB10_01030, partial [Tepidisphaeraceae bacterium]|nr:hypothetical protein [Tepidisphaeraceae bacterium]
MGERGAKPTEASAKPGSLWRARPLVLAAGVFVLGIAVHDRLPIWIGAWVAMSAIAAVSVFVINQHELTSRAMLAIAIFLAGVACAQQSRHRYESTHLSAFVTDEPRLAQLELEIDRPPRVIVLPLANGRPLPPRQVALGRVTGVRTWSGWERATGEVLLQIAE